MSIMFLGTLKVISFTSIISQFIGKYANRHFIEEEIQVQWLQVIYLRSQNLQVTEAGFTS